MQRSKTGGRCSWLQQQRKTTPTHKFASRSFPVLGVLQAAEVMGAPCGEEMSKLENGMRRAVGVGVWGRSGGTPAERKHWYSAHTEHNRLQESEIVPRTHFGHQSS